MSSRGSADHLGNQTMYDLSPGNHRKWFLVRTHHNKSRPHAVKKRASCSSCSSTDAGIHLPGAQVRRRGLPSGRRSSYLLGPRRSSTDVERRRGGRRSPGASPSGEEGLAEAQNEIRDRSALTGPILLVALGEGDYVREGVQERGELWVGSGRLAGALRQQGPALAVGADRPCVRAYSRVSNAPPQSRQFISVAPPPM